MRTRIPTIWIVFCLHSFTKALIKKIFRTLRVKAKGCFSFTASLLNLSKIN